MGLGLAQSLLPPQVASGWPIGLASISGRRPVLGAPAGLWPLCSSSSRAWETSSLSVETPGLAWGHLQVQPGGGHQRGWWPPRSSTLTRGGGECLLVIVETFTTFSDKDTGPGARGCWVVLAGRGDVVLSLWKFSSDPLFYPIFISMQQFLVL